MTCREITCKRCGQTAMELAEGYVAVGCPCGHIEDDAHFLKTALKMALAALLDNGVDQKLVYGTCTDPACDCANDETHAGSPEFSYEPLELLECLRTQEDKREVMIIRSSIHGAMRG